jgi:probable HAF family extracellular repeat protein
VALSAWPALAQTPVNPAYTVTNLGGLGGTYSDAIGINNLGQVVGWSETANRATAHATLFSGTGSGNLDLGSLSNISNNTSIAYAINDSGQIVGKAYGPSGSFQATLFSGTGSNNLNLGSIGGGGGGAAFAINNSGQIAGFSSDQNISNRATLFNIAGSATQVGSYPTYPSLYVYAINNLGQMVGEGWTSSGMQRPVRIYAGGQADLGDLNTYPYVSGWALGINDSGQIVGRSGVSGGALHATLFSGTGSSNVDLGALGGPNYSSYAVSINNAGQIVGESSTGVENHGFIYSGGVMSDLNNLIPANTGVSKIQMGQFQMGRRINEFGQIAAVGQVAGQGMRALRMDPANPLTSISAGGAARNTKFVSGMNYNKFVPTINPSGLGTTVGLLGGIAGNGGAGALGLNRSVDVAFQAGDPAYTVSDILTLSGTEGDTFILQLSYDQSLADGLFGSESNARLGWLSDGEWVLATNGNSGGTSTFVAGPWNSSYGLGFHGVDISTNTVWAVINHNSSFAVVAVPEPVAAILFSLAGFVLMSRTGNNKR